VGAAEATALAFEAAADVASSSAAEEVDSDLPEADNEPFSAAALYSPEALRELSFAGARSSGSEGDYEEDFEKDEDSDEGPGNRVDADGGAAERAAIEHAARGRAEAKRAEAKRAAMKRAEAERLAVERAEAERAAMERAEAERAAMERAETERAEAERVEAARAAMERAEAERAEAERVGIETPGPTNGASGAVEDTASLDAPVAGDTLPVRLLCEWPALGIGALHDSLATMEAQVGRLAARAVGVRAAAAEASAAEPPAAAPRGASHASRRGSPVAELAAGRFAGPVTASSINPEVLPSPPPPAAPGARRQARRRPQIEVRPSSRQRDPSPGRFEDAAALRSLVLAAAPAGPDESEAFAEDGFNRCATRSVLGVGAGGETSIRARIERCLSAVDALRDQSWLVTDTVGPPYGGAVGRHAERGRNPGKRAVGGGSLGEPARRAEREVQRENEARHGNWALRRGDAGAAEACSTGSEKGAATSLPSSIRRQAAVLRAQAARVREASEVYGAVDVIGHSCGPAGRRRRVPEDGVLSMRRRSIMGMF
jgi:hypothetical protein